MTNETQEGCSAPKKCAGDDPPPRLDAVIGQATAGLTIVAAVVYGSGVLTLALKLWFMQVPSGPVLGLLPHDFILTTAFGQIILPTLVAGVAIAAFVDRQHARWSGQKRIWRWGLAVSVALAAVPTGILRLIAAHHWPLGPSPLRGVVRPWWEIGLMCFALQAIAVAGCVAALRWIYQQSAPRSRRWWTVPIVSLALIPSISSLCATQLLPPVHLCGPDFVKSEGATHYMEGNLIGRDGDHLYVASFIYDDETGERVVNRRFISVLPLSSVQLEGIGPYGNCANVTDSTTQPAQ
jgi:hypothetical protein